MCPVKLKESSHSELVPSESTHLVTRQPGSEHHANFLHSVFQQGEDDYNLSNVDYDDVTSKWLSADFLNLRLRSNG